MKSKTKLFVAATLVLAAIQINAADWIRFAKAADQARSLSLVIAPAYASDITVDGKPANWGVGVAALYPVLDVGVVRGYTGARFDWLGNQFWAPSVNVGMTTTERLFNKIDVTAFTIGGAVYSLTSDSNQADALGALYGAGGYITPLKWSNGSVQIGYAWEKWSNFPGSIQRVVGAVSFSF